MKNLVCPVSEERFNENIPRITGLFVVFILIGYLATDLLIFPIYLLIDFYIRGFNRGKYSLLAITANKINKAFGNKGKMIDKAPKLFAARLGFIFTLLILCFDIAGMTNISIIMSGMLILLAFIECVANFCVGCWVFTIFVKPYTPS